MSRTISAIVNLMQAVYTAWHCVWWNYHCGKARLHDDKICRLDPEWRNKI